MNELPKILVVDHEQAVGAHTAGRLACCGFQTRLVTCGLDARRALDSQHWDLVVLDLVLPDLSGESLLSLLQSRPDKPPVLVLTAKAQLSDKIRAFQLGCDDFVAKPCLLEELVERARAVLRRSRSAQSLRHAYEDLALDPLAHRLAAGEVSVQLTPKESAILGVLLSRPAQIVSKRELLGDAWGLTHEPSANFVGAHIANLRRKLAAVGREQWLETVRAKGFVFRRPIETGSPGMRIGLTHTLHTHSEETTK